MLQIKKVHKKFITGDLIQTALDGISLSLRDNEFVAILGPSGSGKTTLLNIIGGLDRYDEGDLIINGISTKRYADRDWDSYRNHTIGFVFQSYNLIPHQSILSNVELALTISGISKNERRKKAKEALTQVGLGDQLHKKPNQMSGGQMQRVAIARALINNPDILLADEPTGALDSETSVQVMELLKEVAKDRLVVMVTHNPELAEEYATRIVKLRDGKILDDSDPFEADSLEAPKHKNMGKSSMSLTTALSLSFNNLRTKKGRTILTSFAGSIGIIGISLILAISSGVNNYITDLQKSTMMSYPVTIESRTMDMSSMISTANNNFHSDGTLEHELDKVYANSMNLELASTVTTSITENNLTEFKLYLDNPESEIHQYIGENGIVYSYNTQFGVYTHDPEGVFVNTDGSTLSDESAFGMPTNSLPMMAMAQQGNMNLQELLPGLDGNLVSTAVMDNYDLLYGQWPASYDEVILILDQNNEIPATSLYQLGILSTDEYKEIMKKIEAGEEITMELQSWNYEDIMEKEFFMIPSCDMYIQNEQGYFDFVGDDVSEMEKLMDSAVQLKVSGIVRPNEEADFFFVTSPVGYTQALTDYIIEYANNSEVVKAQQENKEQNVLNGMMFSPADDAQKAKDAKGYIANLGISDKAVLSRNLLASQPAMAPQMSTMGEMELAAALDSFLVSADESMLISIYDRYISTGNYDDNLASFGVVSLNAPSAINLYADSFEDKDAIAKCIEEYNKLVSEENQISYTDIVGTLMNSVTTIINIISYVLIAFVAVSLVVSSIMIGIITYISVLERTKEIGILRAIGASKQNISQVFNAETFIIGLFAGLMGVGITLLLLIPGNALLHSITGIENVNAVLPLDNAFMLIILSVILTLIGGLLPSKKAAKKDPVAALRTE